MRRMEVVGELWSVFPPRSPDCCFLCRQLSVVVKKNHPVLNIGRHQLQVSDNELLCALVVTWLCSVKERWSYPSVHKNPLTSSSIFSSITFAFLSDITQKLNFASHVKAKGDGGLLVACSSRWSPKRFHIPGGLRMRL